MKFAFTSFLTISLMFICAASPSKADTIFHESSNLCIHPRGGSANPDDNTPLVLHPGGCNNGESRLQFQLLPSGSIQHIASGKCVHPSGGSANPPDNTVLVLHSGCNEPRLSFRLVSGGLQHVSSGKCIHPEGGTAVGDGGLVLHTGCGEQRLAFAFRSINPAAGQASRPYAIFVNGQGNCCAWGTDGLQRWVTMTVLQKRLEELNAEFRYVPYSNFNNEGRSRDDWTSVDTQFLRNGADFINNKLDRNRPLILIGHSYGGDSVLKLLPRLNRRVQFVAVLDPVSTGGLRAPLTRDLSVGSNVDYFFNRWQENEPFPIDFKQNGSLQCSARRKCDQAEQQFATDINSQVIRVRCGRLEFCRTKNKRMGHQTLPTDNGVQRWIGDRISEVLK